jgi:hypothetical protein
MEALELSKNAKCANREMTDVLLQKFAYSGGAPLKAKQLAQPRPGPQVQTSFVDMLSNLEGKNVDPELEFSRLAALLDISNLHPKILAVALHLVNKYGIKDPRDISRDALVSWLKDKDTIVWNKLYDSLPKEPTRSFEAQIVDIYRYMVMIVNHRRV